MNASVSFSSSTHSSLFFLASFLLKMPRSRNIKNLDYFQFQEIFIASRKDIRFYESTANLKHLESTANSPI